METYISRIISAFSCKLWVLILQLGQSMNKSIIWMHGTPGAEGWAVRGFRADLVSVPRLHLFPAFPIHTVAATVMCSDTVDCAMHVQFYAPILQNDMKEATLRVKTSINLRRYALYRQSKRKPLTVILTVLRFRCRLSYQRLFKITFVLENHVKT